MKIISYFFPQIIAVFRSPVNKKISIVQFLGKNSIEAGGLQQSGPLVEKIYLRVFRKLIGYKSLKRMKTVLILGLAGGSSVKLLIRINPDIKITAIELDPVIVDAGIKYLGLNEKYFTVIFGDAYKEIYNLKNKYDLVIVDIFNGYKISSKTTEKKFLHKLQKLQTKDGIVIFNHLYFQNYKNEAEKFLDKVKKIFKDVTSIRAYYNIFIRAK